MLADSEWCWIGQDRAQGYVQVEDLGREVGAAGEPYGTGVKMQVSYLAISKVNTITTT